MKPYLRIFTIALALFIAGVALPQKQAQSNEPINGFSLPFECSPNHYQYRYTPKDNRVFIFGTFSTGSTKKEAELIDTRAKDSRFTIFYKLNALPTPESWSRKKPEYHLGIMESFFLPKDIEMITIEIYDENELLFEEINCLLPQKNEIKEKD